MYQTKRGKFDLTTTSIKSFGLTTVKTNKQKKTKLMTVTKSPEKKVKSKGLKKKIVLL